MVDHEPMIVVENLCLQAGEFRLQDISFRIDPGEYFILLGPTGCGKTMLVEAICGLNRPESGSIHLGGRDITFLDPARRRIGYVPQDYALLPFMTVEQNMAFGLEAHGVDKQEQQRRLEALFEMLDIGRLRNRYPARLSGGERQRVALGRALAIEPDVLVLDEPLSALDESTCKELMVRLKELHTQFKATFIHICHRVEEALTLGDTLAIMRDGHIEQIGTPAHIFSQPQNLFIANFLQLPNITRGTVRATSNGTVFCINGTPVSEAPIPEGPAYGVIPLQDLRLYAEHPGDEDDYAVVCDEIAHNSTGPHAPGLRFSKGIDFFLPGIYPESQWQPGKEIFIRFPRSKVHVLRP